MADQADAGGVLSHLLEVIDCCPRASNGPAIDKSDTVRDGCVGVDALWRVQASSWPSACGVSGSEECAMCARMLLLCWPALLHRMAQVQERQRQ